MIRKDLLSKAFVLSLIISLNGVLITACGSRDSVESIATIEESTEIESSTVEETTETESSVVEESSEIESSVIEESTEAESETETIEATTEEISTEETTVVNVSTEIAVEPHIMYVSSSANVRDLPSKESNVIDNYAQGTEVNVIATDGDFTKIDYEEGFAYIHTSLLTSTKPATQSSSSSTSSTGSSSQSGSTQSQQTQTPAQTTPPTKSSGGKITVNYGGKPTTVTPNGKGWYITSDGIDVDAQGNPVDPITGQPYDTSSTLHEANFTPIDQLPTNSGIKAE